MKSLEYDPKESVFNNILVGIPSFGMVSINFAASLKLYQMPIFTSQYIMPILNKPVDVARNEIAAIAMGQNYGFVWFRDDDVCTDTDALVKLFSRFSPEQRAHPRDVGEVIIGGVVYSKMQPPTPMIFREGCIGGFEDWGYGDIVECDSMGMGATLIPVGVFNRIMADGYDKWQCTNDKCPTNWSVEYSKDTAHKCGAMLVCPTCGGPLAPVMFRTIRNGEEFFEPGVGMTEDTYFCLLAKDHGIKVYADCGVQCKHEDTKTQTMYYYHEGLGLPAWERNGRVEFWPRAELTTRVEEKKPQKKKSGKVKFNVGCGGDIRDGFINMDMTTDCDFKCDVRDLRTATEKYGQADEIHARHVLEHFNRNSVTTAVRNWLKALKPGGKLLIHVPDAIAAINNFLEADSDGKMPADQYNFQEAVVFGAQRYPGDDHRTAITPNKMKKIIRSCAGMIEKHTMTVGRNEGCNQDEIVVEIIKKKATVKPPKKAKKEKK